mmetsp:Transcript_67244/g.216993  ORF Transcript_67244/g.216993 Transcript_67244/m.216993 type:complete len:201 (-) Transcript_67244:1618-2220(-)
MNCRPLTSRPEYTKASFNRSFRRSAGSAIISASNSTPESVSSNSPGLGWCTWGCNSSQATTRLFRLPQMSAQKGSDRTRARSSRCTASICRIFGSSCASRLAPRRTKFICLQPRLSTRSCSNTALKEGSSSFFRGDLQVSCTGTRKQSKTLSSSVPPQCLRLRLCTAMDMETYLPPLSPALTSWAGMCCISRFRSSSFSM